MKQAKKTTFPSDLRYPRIREVEAFPINQNGEQQICLRDPQNIAQNTLVLSPPLFYMITLFDGRHDVKHIQMELNKQFRELIPEEQIESLIEQLDRELYLESDTLRKACAAIEDEFRTAPCRKAFFAGSAYEKEPDRLRKQLQSFIESMNCENPGNGKPDCEYLKALVSPHIDLHRGGRCFAYAYEEIAQSEAADLYLLFGTGHQLRSSFMALTHLSYDTPLGLVETDRDFIDRFSALAPIELFSEELAHKQEHSLEFQALWLRYTLGDSWKGKIVPILCGSLHAFIQQGTSPRSHKKLADTLDLLREMIEDYPGIVSVIAGADMSHVGKRFGHENGIPNEELQRVERDDHEVLDAMVSGNAENFFKSIEKNKDHNHVCGLSPIYMTLDVTRPKTKGKLLKYEQAIEEDTESVVSYASVSFRDS